MPSSFSVAYTRVTTVHGAFTVQRGPCSVHSGFHARVGHIGVHMRLRVFSKHVTQVHLGVHTVNVLRCGNR